MQMVHDLFSGQPYKWLLCRNYTATRNFLNTQKYVSIPTHVNKFIWKYFILFCLLYLHAVFEMETGETEPKRKISWKCYRIAIVSFHRNAVTCFLANVVFMDDIDERIFNGRRYIFACWLHVSFVPFLFFGMVRMGKLSNLSILVRIYKNQSSSE